MKPAGFLLLITLRKVFLKEIRISTLSLNLNEEKKNIANNKYIQGYFGHFLDKNLGRGDWPIYADKRIIANWSKICQL